MRGGSLGAEAAKAIGFCAAASLQAAGAFMGLTATGLSGLPAFPTVIQPSKLFIESSRLPPLPPLARARARAPAKIPSGFSCPFFFDLPPFSELAGRVREARPRFFEHHPPLKPFF